MESNQASMGNSLKILIKAFFVTAIFFILLIFANNFSVYIHALFAAGFLFICFFLFIEKQKEETGFERGKVLKPFLQSLDEGVLLVDGSYHRIVYNKSVCRLLGIRSSDLEKCSFLEIEESSRREVLVKAKQLFEECTLSDPEQKETVTYVRGSQTLATELTAIGISEKETLLIIRDLTKGGVRLNLGKEFIANASHELRTPITIIKGFVETLKEMPEISEAMLEDIFDKILRSCMRMDGIVKNLLILTDLDYISSANMKRFDLLALLDNCRHTILEVYPKVGINIECVKKELITRADPDLLELAMMNLLQNAVKYSQPPAKIEITLEAEPEEYIIQIADSGCGIPKESLPNIFDRFYSVDKQVSRKLGGAGLGLAIVKTIIEKHQGEISAQDNPTGGTIFTVKIPVS